MTMSLRSHQRLQSATLLTALLVLSGCGSSRDSALAEKLARAERAADRAEFAQKAAEEAAKSAKTKLEQINSASDASAVPVEDEGPDEPVDTAGAEIEPAGPA